MGTAITYYIVEGRKLDFPSFELLISKPTLPNIGNFNSLKDFVEMNTNASEESEIIIDLDNGIIVLDIKY